jgi:hypothetical protein
MKGKINRGRYRGLAEKGPKKRAMAVRLQSKFPRMNRRARLAKAACEIRLALVPTT